MPHAKSVEKALKNRLAPYNYASRAREAHAKCVKFTHVYPQLSVNAFYPPPHPPPRQWATWRNNRKDLAAASFLLSLFQPRGILPAL